jgi:hypothetical protein
MLVLGVVKCLFDAPSGVMHTIWPPLHLCFCRFVGVAISYWVKQIPQGPVNIYYKILCDTMCTVQWPVYIKIVLNVFRCFGLLGLFWTFFSRLKPGHCALCCCVQLATYFIDQFFAQRRIKL